MLQCTPRLASVQKSFWHADPEVHAHGRASGGRWANDQSAHVKDVWQSLLKGGGASDAVTVPSLRYMQHFGSVRAL